MMATKNDDLISRKAAIDRIEAYCNGCWSEPYKEE